MNLTFFIELLTDNEDLNDKETAFKATEKELNDVTLDAFVRATVNTILLQLKHKERKEYKMGKITVYGGESELVEEYKIKLPILFEKLKKL